MPRTTEYSQASDLVALKDENLHLQAKVDELTDTLDEVMAENGLLNQKYDAKVQELDSKQVELGDIANQLQALNNEKKQMESELQKIRKHAQSKKDDLVRQVQSNCDALRAKLQKLEQEKDETVANNSSLEDENTTFIEILHRKDQELDALNENFAALRQELDTEKATRAELENNLDVERRTIKDKVGQLTKKMKQFMAEKEALATKLEKSSKEFSAKESKYTAEIEARNKAFRIELEQLKEANREATEEKEKLIDRYSAAIRLLDSREKEMKEMKQTSEELVQERNQLIANLESIRDELSKLKEERAAANDPNVSLDEGMSRYLKAQEKLEDEHCLVTLKLSKVSLRQEIDRTLKEKRERDEQSPSQATEESQVIAEISDLFYDKIVVREKEIQNTKSKDKDSTTKEVQVEKQDHGPLGFVFEVGSFVKGIVPIPLPF